MLHVRDLTKSYPGPDGRVHVLRGVDLDLAAGETLALTGESGSGKSTFLHLVAGLDRPDGGTIRLDGQEIGALDETGLARLRREDVAVVFQQFNLIPSLTVAVNVGFQARLAGRQDPGRDAALMERLGLSSQAAKYPEDLSGGQQQRVAIARALAARPKLILADEPTGNLDEDTAETVLATMLDLARESGAALLLVTHSHRLAERLDRRVHLSHGRLA